MNTEQLKEKFKGIEHQIGWKAKQELIRSIQEKQNKYPSSQTGTESCEQRVNHHKKEHEGSNETSAYR